MSLIQGSGTYDYHQSAASLHTALALAVNLVANGAVVPQIVQLPNKSFNIRWLPAMISKDVKMLVEELELMLPPGVFTGIERNKAKPVNKDRAVNLLSLFISEIVRLVSYNTDDDFFERFFFKGAGHPFTSPGEEALPGGIMSWLQKYFLAGGVYKPTIMVEELYSDNFLIDIGISRNDSSLEAPIPLKTTLHQQQRRPAHNYGHCYFYPFSDANGTCHTTSRHYSYVAQIAQGNSAA